MKSESGVGLAVAAAMLVSIPTTLKASTFEYKAASGYWASSGQWALISGSGSFPNAPGDIAVFNRNVGTTETVSVGNSTTYTVGQFVFKPSPAYYTQVTVDSGFNGTTGKLILSDPSGTSTISFTGQGTEVKFGNRYNAGLLTLDLRSDLLITHALSSDCTLGFASDSTADTAKFTTSTGAKNVTIHPTGTGALTVNSYSSVNTNTSTWYVDGAKATLAIKSNGGLGNAANHVVLQNGGKLRLVGSTFALTHEVEGNGIVAGGTSLTLGTGGAFSPGESIGTLNVTASTLTLDSGSALKIELQDAITADLINVTGSVVLGGSLDLGWISAYSPAGGESWTILTSTTGITGSFDNVLPAGYTTSIDGNNLVLNYVPEPAGIALLGVAGLMLSSRRRKTA